jgi:hypothetical protein
LRRAATARAPASVASSAASTSGIEGQDRLHHRHARERLAEVVSLALVLDHAAAQHRERQFAQHLFGEIDQVAVVGIGRVELEHGELGVVARRQALVAEIAVDLEHALEAADHQALQVQLRRDAQEQVHVERCCGG